MLHVCVQHVQKQAGTGVISVLSRHLSERAAGLTNPASKFGNKESGGRWSAGASVV